MSGILNLKTALDMKFRVRALLMKFFLHLYHAMDSKLVLMVMTVMAILCPEEQ